MAETRQEEERNADILHERLPDQLLAGAGDGGRDVPDKVRWVRSDVEVERLLDFTDQYLVTTFRFDEHNVGVE